MGQPHEPDESPGLRRWALILGFAAISLLFFRQIARCSADGDLYHQMALAREIVLEGRVPWEDRFAFTPTVYPVVHHEWGAGLIALGLVQAIGPTGILLLKFGAAAALAVITVAAARRGGGTPEAMLLVLPLAAILVVPAFATVRAQVYSLAFTALLLWFLEKDRQGQRRWIALWLAVYLIWLNLHAGFLVGCGLFFVTWVGRVVRGEPQRHLLLTGLFMAAAILVNPYGYHYYGYLIRAMTMARPHIAEWQPLWHSPGMLALVLLAAGLAGYALYSTGARNASGVEVAAITLAAALWSERMVPFFGLCFAVYVPGWLTGTLPMARLETGLTQARWLPWLFAAAGSIFLAAGLAERPWLLRVPGRPEGDHAAYPVNAVDYLRRAGFSGNVMVPFDWASYVSWHLGPAVRVSMDARYEAAFAPELELESYAFYMAESGWQQTLGKYPTDLVLVPIHLPLAQAISEAPGWTRVYADGAFEIYARPGLAMPSEYPAVLEDGTFP